MKPHAETRVPRAGGWEGDLIDQANADAEAELQISLHETDGRLLRAIDEALAPMRGDTYGLCELCQQPISKVRLEAVPWARHCRDCKEREHPAAQECRVAPVLPMTSVENPQSLLERDSSQYVSTAETAAVTEMESPWQLEVREHRN